jgi:hypothetical protein
VRDGQPSPHRPRLVVSRSTCPPISPPPLVNSFVLGSAVINTHGRGGNIGGHVLRETMSRGLCGLICSSRTSERGGEGDCVKEGGGRWSWERAWQWGKGCAHWSPRAHSTYREMFKCVWASGLQAVDVPQRQSGCAKGACGKKSRARKYAEAGSPPSGRGRCECGRSRF